MGILLNMFLIAGWYWRILPSVGDVIPNQVAGVCEEGSR